MLQKKWDITYHKAGVKTNWDTLQLGDKKRCVVKNKDISLDAIVDEATRKSMLEFFHAGRSLVHTDILYKEGKKNDGMTYVFDIDPQVEKYVENRAKDDNMFHRKIQLVQAYSQFEKRGEIPFKMAMGKTGEQQEACIEIRFFVSDIDAAWAQQNNIERQPVRSDLPHMYMDILSHIEQYEHQAFLGDLSREMLKNGEYEVRNGVKSVSVETPIGMYAENKDGIGFINVNDELFLVKPLDAPKKEAKVTGKNSSEIKQDDGVPSRKNQETGNDNDHEKNLPWGVMGVVGGSLGALGGVLLLRKKKKKTDHKSRSDTSSVSSPGVESEIETVEQYDLISPEKPSCHKEDQVPVRSVSVEPKISKEEKMRLYQERIQALKEQITLHIEDEKNPEKKKNLLERLEKTSSEEKLQLFLAELS